MNTVVPHRLACRNAPCCQYSLQSARKCASCMPCHCCAVAFEHGDCLQTHRITNIRISLWMPFVSGQSILVLSVFCYTTRFFNFVRYENFGIKPFLYSCIFIFKYIIVNRPVLDATLAEFFSYVILLLFDWYWYSSFGISFTKKLYKCSNKFLLLFALQYWYLLLAVVPSHDAIITFAFRE
jgi:hypothetical protein